MLNRDHFTCLAGNPDRWDTEILEAKDRDRDPKSRNPRDADFNLCAAQRNQHARGRRSAELVKSIRGWTVRSGSGLDDFRILFGGRHEPPHTFAEAVAWGRAWANEDPNNREFYVRNSTLNEAEKDGESLEGIR